MTRQKAKKITISLFRKRLVRCARQMVKDYGGTAYGRLEDAIWALDYKGIP